MKTPAGTPQKVVADRLDIRQNALAQYMTLAGYSPQEVGTAIDELIKNCGQAEYARDSDKGVVYMATGVRCGGVQLPRIEFTIHRNQIVHVGGLKETSTAPISQAVPSL